MSVAGRFAYRLLALVLGILGTYLVHAPARADTPQCSLADHCRSVLTAGDSDGTIRQGMWGSWNRAAMSTGCSGTSHRWMTSEMWMWPYNNGGAGWVEAGHSAGWLDPGGSCDYYAFAAWQKEDGTGYTERMLARLNAAGATTDEFQISRASSTNVFHVYYNGSRVTTSNVQFWNSRRFHMGGEVATAYGTSSDFNMTGRALNADGDRVALPSPQGQSVDNPPLLGNSPAGSAWNWSVA